MTVRPEAQRLIDAQRRAPSIPLEGLKWYAAARHELKPFDIATGQRSSWLPVAQLLRLRPFVIDDLLLEEITVDTMHRMLSDDGVRPVPEPLLIDLACVKLEVSTFGIGSSAAGARLRARASDSSSLR